MKDEKVMITCCSDGTRPVIFKIERLDYKVLYIDGISCDGCREKIRSALETLDGVSGVTFREEFAEVFLEKDMDDARLTETVGRCGAYRVARID